MSVLPRDVLEDWPGRWRYPDLLVHLSGAEERLSSGEAARMIARGISEPLGPDEVIDRLIDTAEYGVALQLLEDQLFVAVLDMDVADVRGRIHVAQRKAARELEARALALEKRAVETGLSAPRPFETPVDVEALVDLEAALEEFEGRVELAEAGRRSELRRLLESAMSEIDPAAGDLGDYVARVETCIELRQFKAAEHLLQHRPNPRTGERASESWPAARRGRLAARPQRYPWRKWPDDYALEDVLSWFDDAAWAPAEYFRTWQLAPDDEAAHDMIRALRILATMPAGEDFEDASAALGSALDRLLGEEPAVDGRNELVSLDDPLLAPFRVFTSRPVRLDVVEEPSPPSELRSPEVMLDPLPPGRRGSGIDARELIGLVADSPSRRVGLLRAIGSRLDTRSALRAGDPRAWGLPEMSTEELELYVEWLIDILGLEPDAVFGDVLVSLAADRVDLAIVLLREVLAETTSGTITREELVRAADGEPFRAAVEAAILGPLDDDPVAQVVLATLAFWYDGPGAEALSPPRWHELLAEMAEVPPDAEAVAVSAAKLSRLGLVQAVEDGYRANPAIARLMLVAVDDAETFIAQKCRRSQ